jgi:hypothetical protein
MDLVYVIARSLTGDYPELVYSIRSMHAHQEFGRVWLAGQPPSDIFTDEVRRVYVPKGTDRYRNTSDNLHAAMLDPTLSDPFILMNDDFFCLSDDAHCAWNRGSLRELLQHKRRGSMYRSGGLGAYQFLQSYGCEEPLSFELHIPMVVHKGLMQDVIEALRAAKVSEAFKRTVYGNLQGDDTDTRDDVKRAALPLAAHDWVSTTGPGWPGTVGQHIRSLYSEPSPLERESR